MQGDIDFKDKTAVEAADRKRFEFVNGIVKQVEKRKVFTKDKNVQDKIDGIITHKIIGIPISQQLSSLCSTYPRQRSVPGSQTGWWHRSELSRAGSAD